MSAPVHGFVMWLLFGVPKFNCHHPSSHCNSGGEGHPPNAGRIPTSGAGCGARPTPRFRLMLVTPSVEVIDLRILCDSRMLPTWPVTVTAPSCTWTTKSRLLILLRSANRLSFLLMWLHCLRLTDSTSAELFGTNAVKQTNAIVRRAAICSPLRSDRQRMECNSLIYREAIRIWFAR